MILRALCAPRRMASCGDESLVSGGASPLQQLQQQQQQQEQQRQGPRRTDPAESKADAPHSNVQSLFEAVVHVRALLDAEQQSAVLSECCALYSRLGPAAHYGSVEDIMRQRAHRGKYLLFFENSVRRPARARSTPRARISQAPSSPTRFRSSSPTLQRALSRLRTVAVRMFLPSSLQHA
jgi:hypothetical protein